MSENSFSKLIRNKRQELYKSAKQFHTAAQLNCTYYYYSRIENGAELPNIELAVSIIRSLNLELRTSLYAWVSELMPDEESKSIFSSVSSDYLTMPFNPDQSTIISRAQKSTLESEILLFEITIYINCIHPKRASLKDISDVFSISEDTCLSKLNKLYDMGIINCDKSLYYANEWVFIPQTKEYEKLRNIALQRAFQQYMRQSKGFTFQNAITLPLSETSQKILSDRLKDLSEWLISSEVQSTCSNGARPFTFGYFGSERLFGD